MIWWPLNAITNIPIHERQREFGDRRQCDHRPINGSDVATAKAYTAPPGAGLGTEGSLRSSGGSAPADTLTLDVWLLEL